MRTSSNILFELIEYRKRMEAWHAGSDVTKMEDADQCILEIPLKYLEQ